MFLMELLSDSYSTGSGGNSQEPWFSSDDEGEASRTVVADSRRCGEQMC